MAIHLNVTILVRAFYCKGTGQQPDNNQTQFFDASLKEHFLLMLQELRSARNVSYTALLSAAPQTPFKSPPQVFASPEHWVSSMALYLP